MKAMIFSLSVKASYRMIRIPPDALLSFRELRRALLGRQDEIRKTLLDSS